MPSVPDAPLEIVLATGNPHKVEELRAIMGPLRIPIIGLSDLPGHPFAEPTESGTTFEQNATIKALAYAEATGRLCLADDSGLEIDALSGKPGVISSHYCTDGREEGMDRPTRDAANNARVLKELDGVPPDMRTARFVCVMALATPSNVDKWGAGVSPAAPTAAPKEARTFDGKQQWSYSGDLPHFQVGGATYFVTFRCVAPPLSIQERQIVADSLLFWHGNRMMLHVATVMTDHVHMLFRPIRQPDGNWPRLDALLHSIKSYSAHQINRLRGSAKPLWQAEYFDRVMRDEQEMQQAAEYIEHNPVEEGLAEAPKLYPFTVRGTRGGRDARPPSAEGVIIARSRGTFEGRIGIPPAVPAGTNGFGYDPLFIAGPDFLHTGAQLTPDEKNKRSHRAAAATRMAKQIIELFVKPPSEKDPHW